MTEPLGCPFCGHSRPEPPGATLSPGAGAGRKPLTKAKLSELARAAQIKFCLKSGGSFEEELARAVERAHGIVTGESSSKGGES